MVFDATSLIAFLDEMSCPECIVKLSAHCELFVPEGVVKEVAKQSGKGRLQGLIRCNVIRTVAVDRSAYMQLRYDNPHLGDGECEAIVAVLTQDDLKDARIISDDKDARRAFGSLRFVWTEELLDTMRDRGVISAGEYASSMRRLRGSRFYSRDRRA